MTISDNIHFIKKQLRKAALAGNPPQLIAVSKNQSIENIQEALNAGHRVFGENRVHDAITKWKNLRAALPDLKLHLIGPLQSNKASEAVRFFDVIHSVDRPNLVIALVKEIRQLEKENIPSFFIQVNTGEEQQKSGVRPDEVNALLSFCHNKGLPIKGLMCIPPLNQPSSLHFALLKKIAKRHHLDELSMGMSNDYRAAAALGASYVRVGNAIFGDRNYSL